MSELKRVLIGSVELAKTKSGKPVVNLWSTDTRLQFPALRLFDLSALTAVGIDPDSLGMDRVYRRLWAYYTESEKRTSEGNPYCDVQYLETIDAPATATSAAVGDAAVLAELRAIRALLQTIAGVREDKLIIGLDSPTLQEPEQPPANGNGNGDHDESVPPIVVPPDEDEPDLVVVFGKRKTEKEKEPEPQPQVPIGATALLDQLKREKYAYTSAGHVLHDIRKQVGDPAWGWPVTSDIQGWQQALDAARAAGKQA